MGRKKSDDIVDGIVKAYNYKNGFEVFNLGYGAPTKTIDFIKKIEDISGIKANIEYVGRQLGDVHTTYASNSKAKRILGFNPKVEIDSGLRRYFEWFKDYYRVENVKD